MPHSPTSQEISHHNREEKCLSKCILSKLNILNSKFYEKIGSEIFQKILEKSDILAKLNLFVYVFVLFYSSFISCLFLYTHYVLKYPNFTHAFQIHQAVFFAVCSCFLLLITQQIPSKENNNTTVFVACQTNKGFFIYLFKNVFLTFIFT